MNGSWSYVPGAVSGIRARGSELLLTFVEEAVRLGATRLHAVAYVDDILLADDEFRPWWGDLLRSTNATIVVRTLHAAEAVAKSLERVVRLHDVRLNSRLHAKVYVAHRNGGAIALAGSHNLTGAALRGNVEAGLLITPGANAELRRLVRDLRVSAEDVARRSTPWTGRPGGPA